MKYDPIIDRLLKPFFVSLGFVIGFLLFDVMNILEFDWGNVWLVFSSTIVYEFI